MCYSEAEGAHAAACSLPQVAPKVMSLSQLTAAAKAELVRKFWGKDAAPKYTPSSSNGVVDHFVLHPGKSHPDRDINV